MSYSESRQMIVADNAQTECEEKNPKAPFYAAIILIILFMGLFAGVYLANDILPDPLTIAQEKEHHYDFIAERAFIHLKKLTDLGPRVQGSMANEILAVDYLLEQIELIKNNAYFNKKFEVDLQVISGAYTTDTDSLINAYGNIQNVLVKLYHDFEEKESVLINTHFDTVPASPGGSDDGINCATALEVLRKLSRFTETFHNNFIFLFNGAEETPLQASHAFITHHKWAKEVKVVINLEASGAGGKSLVFQLGPKKPWLLAYYKNAPHAYANVLGEELHLSGMGRSKTDFGIFRTFGNLSGLDLAFHKDAYRYHTSYDGFDNIPKGSYQHIGDNVLSLAWNLGNAPELAKVEDQPTDGVVYFDYISLFFVSYTETVAITLHSVFAVLIVIIIIKTFRDFKLGLDKKSMTYFSARFAAIIVGWMLAIGCNLLIGVILDKVKFSMSWFTNTWILFGLYVAPTVLCTCGLVVAFNRFNPTKITHLTATAQAQIQASLTLLTLTLILLILTILRIRSAYIVFLTVLFQFIALGLINLFRLQERLRIWPFIYLIATIFPNISLIQLSTTFVEYMIPISGRSGSCDNPEIFIALVTSAFTILIICFYVPLITIISRPSLILLGLFGIFLVHLIFVFTPLGFPYSGNPDSPKPQRFWIYHANRVLRDDNNTIYKSDSGYFFSHKDRNSPDSVTDYVDELENAISIEDDCFNSLYCGLPIGREAVKDIKKETIWIPAKAANFKQPIKLTLNSRSKVNKTTTRFEFTAEGPDHMEIYISPRTDATIAQINLVKELPPSKTWNDRPIYVIIYGWGKTKTPLSFAVDVRASIKFVGPHLDIALVGRYVHSENVVLSKEYKRFLNKFPEWTDIMPMMSSYENWVY